MEVVARTAAEELDLEFLRRAAAGDNQAFDRLIGPRLEKLFRIARAILGHEAAARDQTQEACVRAWRDLSGLRDPARFDAWLTQILVNCCRTYLGRRRRVNVREISIDDAAALDRHHRTAATRRQLADDIVDAQAVRRAFGRLDPDTRTLLVLHYVEARPIAEMAAALRAPAGTIKWRLSRARDALERALEAER